MMTTDAKGTDTVIPTDFVEQCRLRWYAADVVDLAKASPTTAFLLRLPRAGELTFMRRQSPRHEEVVSRVERLAGTVHMMVCRVDDEPVVFPVSRAGECVTTFDPQTMEPLPAEDLVARLAGNEEEETSSSVSVFSLTTTDPHQHQCQGCQRTHVYGSIVARSDIDTQVCLSCATVWLHEGHALSGFALFLCPEGSKRAASKAKLRHIDANVDIVARLVLLGQLTGGRGALFAGYVASLLKRGEK